MSNKKHRHDRIEQRGRPSTELQLTVGTIAFAFRFEAVTVLLFGVLVLFLGLVFFVSESTDRGLGQIGYEAVILPVIGLVVCGLGFFMLRVASAFQAFEAWAFPWVEFLTFSRRRYGQGFLFVFRDLYDGDLRRAFNQPEYEYPEHPEYGPKLDDQGRPKRPRDQDDARD